MKKTLSFKILTCLIAAGLLMGSGAFAQTGTTTNGTTTATTTATTTPTDGTGTTTGTTTATTTPGGGTGTTTTATTTDNTTATSTATTTATSTGNGTGATTATTTATTTPGGGTGTTTGTSTATTTATTTPNGGTGTTTATTTATTTVPNRVVIQITKHLCNANIKNVGDFEALERNTGPVAAFANMLANCPVATVGASATTTGTTTSPQANFDFLVTGQNGTRQTLSSATAKTLSWTEMQLGKDMNNDGSIASSTLISLPYYEFPNVSAENARVEVTEAFPTGYAFGAVRFIPTELMENTDRYSYLYANAGEGRIGLDLGSNTDKSVMLHVFNFASNATGGDGGASNNADITNQINSLFSQIQTLFAQIQSLLGTLR